MFYCTSLADKQIIFISGTVQNRKIRGEQLELQRIKNCTLRARAGTLPSYRVDLAIISTYIGSAL